MLSGYQLMWMIVMFDLPVGKRAQRKAATKFRNMLLDEGFSMCQFSVYMRFCSGKESVSAYTKRIREQLPEYGNVQILTLTDKQYEKIISFTNYTRDRKNENPGQYVLF